MRRPTRARTLRRSRSSGSSTTTYGAKLKRQRIIDEMMGAAGPVSNDVEVKQRNQVMEIVDVTELTASPEFAPQQIDAIRQGR